MTLVARIVSNGFQFMLGDALISAPIKAVLDPNSKLSICADLPAIPVGLRPEREYSFQEYINPPIGLMQKIIMIDDRLVFGWSGSLDIAQRVVPALRKSLEGWKSIDEVNAAFASISSDDRRELHYLGLAIAAEGAFSFHNAAVAVACKRFEYAEAIGSGSIMLHRFIDECPGLRGSEGSIIETATSMLGLGATMLHAEFLKSVTTEEAFGGAYEVVVAFEDQLIKYPAATTAFWQVELSGAQVLAVLKHLTRFHYVGDHQVTRTFAQQNEHAGLQEVFVASPVDRLLSRSETEEVAATVVDVHKHVLLNVIEVFRQGKWVGNAIFAQPQGDEWFIKCEQAAFHIRQELVNRIGAIVRKAEQDGRFQKV